MLSLDKTKSIDDLVKFSDDKLICLMWKLDGLTISLHYSNGELVGAETRGDGEVGEDVLHSVKAFANVPLHIDYTGDLVVDGEAIITYDDFDKYNADLPDDEKAKNPRNLAAGSVRQLNPEITKQRNVKFYAWKCVKGCDNINSQWSRLRWLDQLGFDTTFAIIDTPPAFIDEFKFDIPFMKEIANDEYIPIDGLVVMYDDIAYGESLGMTGHHPHHSIAFKFANDEYETVLRDIEWDVSRTGLVNPTAVFDPVIIDGCMIARATLHNISYIEALELGLGDTITIIKANEIIPKVVGNLTRSNTYKIPVLCPYCNSELVTENANGSKTLKCPNEHCEGRTLDKLTHFVGKKAMNIEGLSEATIKKFYDRGWLKNYCDIYHLDDYKDEIIAMDGFGQKSWDKLWSSIQNSANVRLENYLVALSIPLVGTAAAKTISRYFVGDYNKFITAVSSGFDFKQLDDFGEALNQSIHNWWKNISPDEVVLAKHMNFETGRERVGKEYRIIGVDMASNFCTGKSFVVTGKLENYTRDSITEFIEQHGGKVLSSVSSKCDYLINNDINSNSSKNKRAKALNIPIIDEMIFMQNF